jgi:hypothetical protein
LLAGRICGGISTSLLFCVFDAWVCGDHAKHSKDKEVLKSIFSKASLGNSIVAILAGIVAQRVTELQPLSHWHSSIHFGGYLLPFDLAVCVLLFTAALIAWTWDENYGSSSKASQKKSKASGKSALREALEIVVKDRKILLTGLICSFFEASMYIFVFMWTPALTSSGSSVLPFGLIFSAFMTACMLGSQLFSTGTISLGLCVAIAAVSHLVIAFNLDKPVVVFFAFLIFETSVGMYFPAAGTRKAQIVPESHRASIYSLFRVPLNVIVVGTLVAGLQAQTAFQLTSTLLTIASALFVFT